MIRKWHYRTLQTNPRHHEEETRNTNSHATERIQLSKATSSLFFNKMIVKLKGTQVLHHKTRTLHKTPQTMGPTSNINEPTTEPPPWSGQQPKLTGEH